MFQDRFSPTIPGLSHITLTENKSKINAFLLGCCITMYYLYHMNNELNSETMTATIQNQIENQTGIKLTARKGTGSMRGLTYLQPRKVNGQYPKFNFDYVQGLQDNASIFAAFPDYIIIK